MAGWALNFNDTGSGTYGDVGVPPMLDPNYPDVSGTYPQSPGQYNPTPTFPTGGNATGSTLGTVLNTATGIFGSLLGYKLQSQQIKAGQYPSVAYQNGYMPTGQPVTFGGLNFGAMGGSGFIWLLIIGVLLLLFLRH